MSIHFDRLPPTSDRLSRPSIKDRSYESLEVCGRRFLYGQLLNALPLLLAVLRITAREHERDVLPTVTLRDKLDQEICFCACPWHNGRIHLKLPKFSNSWYLELIMLKSENGPMTKFLSVSVVSK